MNKSLVLNFLKVLGYKVEPEHLIVANAATDETATATDTEEPSPEVQTPAAAEQPTAVVNAAPPPATPPPAAPAKPDNGLPDNIRMLDELITAVGGFEAFKGLLLKLAEMDQPDQPVQQVNRMELSKMIVANSQGKLKMSDLEPMGNRALVALSEMFSDEEQQEPPNFEGLGVLLRQNARDQGADATPLKRPTVLLKRPTAVQ
jgi:hypothetical protein